jgi:hypothetical protein
LQKQDTLNKTGKTKTKTKQTNKLAGWERILASIRRFFSPPENILMGAIACLPVNKNWRK